MSNSMHDNNGHDAQSAPFARPDFGRAHRKGVPEVILSDTKASEQCLSIAHAFLECGRGGAILSRVTPELWAVLEDAFPEASIEWHAAARAAVIRAPGQVAPSGGGPRGHSDRRHLGSACGRGGGDGLPGDGL